MQFQFNSDSSVMGTDDVAERIEAQVREKLTRFEERLTRLEVHVHNEHHHTHGNDGGQQPRKRRRIHFHGNHSFSCWAHQGLIAAKGPPQRGT